MESSWENIIIYVNLGLKQIESFRKNECPRYNAFRLFRICFGENVSTYFENNFGGDEERAMINCPLIKSAKAWI